MKDLRMYDCLMFKCKDWYQWHHCYQLQLGPNHASHTEKYNKKELTFLGLLN